MTREGAQTAAFQPTRCGGGRDLPRAEHVLVLGGTSEASALVAALANAAACSVTLSLAGRTASPKPAPVPTRSGGFGGIEGLARWIAENGVTRVVDATHPFAAQISRNAAAACTGTGTPLLALRRPAWDWVAGDTWIEVADMAAAAEALGAIPRRVFLTIGRQELAAFARASHHAYHARMIEPPDEVGLPRLTVIRARGPFSVEDETQFLLETGIEILVSKNAGGTATYAKIAAARACGLPVVMVRRPTVPDVASVETIAEALAWLRAVQPATPRGV